MENEENMESLKEKILDAVENIEESAEEKIVEIKEEAGKLVEEVTEKIEEFIEDVKETAENFENEIIIAAGEGIVSPEVMDEALRNETRVRSYDVLEVLTKVTPKDEKEAETLGIAIKGIQSLIAYI